MACLVGKHHSYVEGICTMCGDTEVKEVKQGKVNHPSHYNRNKFEVIDIIEDAKLGFHLGNAIKYILRADFKNNRIEDLKKAIWYLQRIVNIKETKETDEK